jgi:hypothetical protein
VNSYSFGKNKGKKNGKQGLFHLCFPLFWHHFEVRDLT